ncbi:MAG: carbamoyltransferase C-terminal domain-containing protein [Patescibacteria group bacterium]
MKILGLHIETHDTGAALIKDGKIVAAVNEERFSRIKMDGSIPWRSITEILKIANIKEREVDIIAFSGFKPGLKKLFYFFWQQNQRVWYTRGAYLKSFLNPKTFEFRRFLHQTGIAALIEYFRITKGAGEIIKNFRNQGFTGSIEFIDHDFCHAAGAFFTSGFEKGMVAIIEGSSFNNTASFWRGEGGNLKKIHEIFLPHSIGRYYEVVTAILGFHPKKHGGKITGLAAFGDPKKYYDKVAALLEIKELEVKVSPKLFSLYDEYFARGRKLPRCFEGATREDIAAAFQKRLEDVVLELLKNLFKKYPNENIALSGGVCANVKLNMEIMRLPQVKKIFIHPGMGDVGEALGVALAAYKIYNPDFKPFELNDIYFGPEYSDEEINAALEKYNLKWQKPSDLAIAVAELLNNKKVVGLFQGRLEYGPRALGNRSILYPATDHSVNDWLNKQLKRTEFMPFAPVTLNERAYDCYHKEDIDKCRYAAQFMTIAVGVTDYMREKMPAAVHIDGTARPQLIKREANPLYYDILKNYETLTGLPSLVNTSFNMHEEPIVCTPEDAIKAYEASKLDALVIGSFLVVRDHMSIKKEKEIKLDVGCAKNKKEGYIGVDIDPESDADIITSALDLPFDDNSVGEIYSRHLVEHFSPDEAEKFFNEIYRVLKKGGEAHLKIDRDWSKKRLLNKSADHKYRYSTEEIKNFVRKFSKAVVKNTFSFSDRTIRNKIVVYLVK